MAGLHIIIGEDEYLVSEMAKKALGDCTGLETIDSLNSTNAELQLRDIGEVQASVATPPFLEPSKGTWWKNVGFLPNGGKSYCAEESKAALERLAAWLVKNPLPENQTFVLTAPKLLKTSVFAKTLAKAAEIVTLSAGRPKDEERAAVERAVEFAAEAGFKFDRGVAEEFVAKVGRDTRTICSEIAKLRDYLGDERQNATKRDVAEISSPEIGSEPSLWSVTDALGARNAAELVAAASPFAKTRGFAVMISSVVEKFLRQLEELKDAQARGMAERVTAGMPSWVASKNLGFLRNWSLRDLRVSRARFVRLRESAVSSSGSADERTMIELVRACCKNLV